MAGKHKTQKSLTEWTQQDWRTADGKRARRKGGTARYLPAAAWEALTPEQVVATNKKKREASKKGSSTSLTRRPLGMLAVTLGASNGEET